MAAGNELGITSNAPYGTSTGTAYQYYIDGNSGAVSARYLTENPIFAPLYTAIFPRLRIIANAGSSDYGTTYPNKMTRANQIWAAAVKAYSPTTYILYGATNNNSPAFNPQDYSRYSTYIQADAQWAQDNEMDAYCIGNENLISNAHTGAAMMTVASLTRSSNVVTATFSADHGLTTGDKVFVTGATPSDFNVADSESSDAGVAVTVVNSTTVTYASTGSDGSATGTLRMQWTAYEVVRKTKALGAVIQSIFTRGPIQYTESQGHETPWINLGITPGTDIDLFGINAYGDFGGNSTTPTRYAAWKATIDACWAAFNTNLIITEMNAVGDSGHYTLDGYSNLTAGAEVIFDNLILLEYEYARTLGITQIYLFGTAEYTIFCNTNPAAGVGGTHYDDAYWIGDFKPLVDKVRGIIPTRVFLGTNSSTGNGGH